MGKDPDHIHGTLHYAVNGKHEADAHDLKTPKPYEDFHIYAAEWFPEHIDFFYDKLKYHTVQIDKAGKDEKNPFRAPHYLLLNFALGGEWGGPIDDAILPQKLLINYVHVYSKGDGAQNGAATQPAVGK